MGKKSKKKSAAKSASKAPTKAPASVTKTGGKKRTSAKAATAPAAPQGGVMAAITDMMNSGAMPALPSFSGSSSVPAMPTINPRTGQITFRRKKSRKGLSQSDIKGFLRVNKFAAMLTKVSGVKHRAKISKRK